MSKRHRVNVYMPPALSETLERVARLNHMSEADLIRAALSHWLKAGMPLFLTENETNGVIITHQEVAVANGKPTA